MSAGSLSNRLSHLLGQGRCGLPRYQDWARRQTDDSFRHAAYEDVGQSCPPMRTHDDEVRTFISGCVDNLLERDTLNDGYVALETGLMYAPERRLHTLGNTCLQVLQVQGWEHGFPSRHPQ